MRAIKNISHNAAICEDGAGRRLIALGRGIGFAACPHEVSLDDVSRTFYEVDDRYLAFVGEVDPEVLEFSAQLADLATQQLSYELSPNLPITLADHIQFALKRTREHMVVPLAISEDVCQTHPVEYRIGQMAVRGLRRTFGVSVSSDEAAGVALSIVNAAVSASVRRTRSSQRDALVLTRVTEIVERELGIAVNRDSFAYVRFTTHLRYLLRRLEEGAELDSQDQGLYAALADQAPRAATCARKAADLLEAEFRTTLTEEELTYLMLHVSRIASHAS